jgi:hypothetical protein
MAFHVTAPALKSLVRFLEQQFPNDREHIEGARSEIGCCRVRPEEIGGAALYRELAVRYPQAEDGGLFIRGDLTVLRQCVHV